MKETDQRKAAKEFAIRWKDKGYEKGQSQKYWMELLQKVYGVEDPFSFVEFEDRVKTDTNSTDFIDVVIPSTKILIEQKSIEVDLDKAVRQSNGQLLTPYDQARKYYNNLPKSKLPDYIITCNFKQFNIYDMERPNGEPERIFLNELDTDYYRLKFIVNSKSELLKKEENISKDAGDLIGEIYDAFSNELDMDNEENQKIVNILCVRLVFCLYAEDSQLFNKNLFYDYIKNSDLNHIQNDLFDLFKVLNTEERDSFTRRDLLDFPFVNGGLFSEEVKIPYFPEKAYDILINKACKFNWSEISPTIFGGIFESTLNPETRRSGGMHYTSVENIHKVIDPLFLDALKDEFNKIKSVKTRKDKRRQLLEFQDKMSNLKFLDPACGSGNFLTESYRCLRQIENDIIRELIKLEGQGEGQITLGMDDNYNPIKIRIQQFYGIEINDFAVAVARTALWIQEAQMFSETQSIVFNNNQLKDFLPLDPYDNIIEANALRIDWNNVLPREKCNYVMGNPPFVGANNQTPSNRSDMKYIFGEKFNSVGLLDYVTAWYKKASSYIGLDTECAFVSTNSITQGEQPGILWNELFKSGIKINFAYRTFRWDSEANIKAHVHCVIIGFSKTDRKNKWLFENNMTKLVKNINAYLIAADNIIIRRREEPFQNHRHMEKGNMPYDGGHLLLDEDEKNELVKKEPKSIKYIKKIIGSKEFINNINRYCLWLKDCPPNELMSMPLVLERVNRVREARLNMKDVGAHKLANTPTVFREQKNPKQALVIPETSSEKRKYIPMTIIDDKVVLTNSMLMVENGDLLLFGIMTSNVHMAWMRAVGGRLEMRYRYSAKIVYNNFPWPNPTIEQKEKIEKTAKMILDARKLYPESSLADMYGEHMYLFPELLKAHQENDKAVMEAYNFDWRNMTESECVAELMKMYQKLNNN